MPAAKQEGFTDVCQAFTEVSKVENSMRPGTGASEECAGGKVFKKDSSGKVALPELRLRARRERSPDKCLVWPILRRSMKCWRKIIKRSYQRHIQLSANFVGQFMSETRLYENYSTAS
jgi:hypothetical protein